MERHVYYKHTTHFDLGKPNNGFESGIYNTIFEDAFYDFEDDFLENNVRFEKEGNRYFILDSEGERTGEVYEIISSKVRLDDETLLELKLYMDENIKARVRREHDWYTNEEYLLRYLELDPKFRTLLENEFDYVLETIKDEDE